MFEKTKEFFRGIKPIILSHHPVCEYFNDGSHTMKLFGKDWCIGCFVTYPVAFLLFTFGSIFNLFSIFSTRNLFIIGFSLCGAYLLSIIGLTKKKPIKILSKMVIGCGISFCLAGIWSLPLKISPRISLTYFFFLLGIAFINVMRGYSIYKICHNCEFKGEWHTCPGMGFILHPE